MTNYEIEDMSSMAKMCLAHNYFPFTSIPNDAEVTGESPSASLQEQS